MELFEDATTVRLKSYNDKYLIAAEDQDSILQYRNGSIKNAHWTVEIVDGDHLCFKSCYGTYLTASNKPILPGRRGRYLRVVQTLPDKLNSSVQWEPVREGDDLKVLLKTRYGNVLQSNEGPLPWRNSVTHDIPRKNDQTSKKFLWQVEVVETPPADQWREESESIIAKSISYVRNICFEVPEKKKRTRESDSMKEGKETKKQEYPPDFVRSFFANF